ncbi:sensor domain-containing diguanylate cyclase [Halobacillus litoralis]|uniref:sensor domain-containing diguanylate cyclase n=1 Tax=Halobacillus litoralis TaxID=45668 RepID=UPI002492C4D5|nr:diguanylate cyclase [Halobacillus litoralis]
MIVKNFIEQRIQKIQSQLFELLTTETPYTFEQFIVNLSIEMEEVADAHFSAIYFLDEWKGHFRLYSETSPGHPFLRNHFSLDDLIHPDSDSLSSKEVEHIIRSGDTTMDLSITSLGSGKKIFGFLVLGFDQLPSFGEGLFKVLSDELTKCIKKVEGLYSTLEEKKKYELLYKVTSQFHSSIDTDGVLNEVIETLRKVYPDFQYYLLLSQDYTTDKDLPVRELAYDMDPSSKASIQAYMKGEIQIEDRLQEKQSYLYAPLKGKQGIYGVLQVVAPSYLYFPKKDIEFFLLIANTAGNALENAQLYQQSRKLNDDLQLINSTSQKLNSNIRLTEKISFMAFKIEQSFHAHEVGFLTWNEEQPDYYVLEGSSSFFTSKQCTSLVKQLEKMVQDQDEALFIGDFKNEMTEEYSPFRSVMAVPMTDHEHINGLAVVLHKEPYFFTFESFKLLQSLVHHSTLAFANSMLREKLEEAVITDYLTKLHSRIHLDECVEKHIEDSQEGHLILFDIDDFKLVNDTYGHQIGDEVICQVADVIKDNIEGVGIAARWGGEELAVFLPLISAEEAHELAERMRKKVVVNTHPSVTVSCGLASWNILKSMPDRKQIVQRADQALYKAKNSGKNKLVVAEEYRNSF